MGSHLRDLNMPKDTRIAALFRGRKLLHPSGSTQLELNDVLCVIGHAKDLPALSKLFSTTSAPSRLDSRRFFGDFILEGSALLGDVGKFYGFEVSPDTMEMTLAAFFVKQFGNYPVVGDKIEWQGLTLMVAAIENDLIQKVGLKLNDGKSEPAVPPTA